MILEKINEVRELALKQGKKGLAIDLKQIMMRHYRKDSHQLIKATKSPQAIKAAVPGPSAFYTSRSGADVSHIVEGLQPHIPKKKTVTVVTESRTTPMQIVQSQTFEAMKVMNDAELEALFTGENVERKWLKEIGYPVHPNAKSETVRKRTRLALSELSNSKDEEE